MSHQIVPVVWTEQIGPITKTDSRTPEFTAACRQTLADGRTRVFTQHSRRKRDLVEWLAGMPGHPERPTFAFMDEEGNVLGTRVTMRLLGGTESTDERVWREACAAFAQKLPNNDKGDEVERT